MVTTANTAVATRQAHQGTLHSTINHYHPDQINQIKASTNHIDLIDMAGMSDSQDTHSMVHTIPNSTEATSQDTIKEDKIKMDTINEVSTDLDTVLGTTKVAKTRVDTMQDTTKEEDTSVDITTPEEILRRTSVLNL